MNDDDAYYYYDGDYPKWIGNGGRSSFELAPVASVVLLAALFGGVGSWAYCRSRNALWSLGLALAAIALGCIGLTISITYGFGGNLLIPCGSTDEVAGNLGIGILLGLHLAACLGLMSAMAAGQRARYLRKKVYADRGQVLTGTVVQKSTKTTVQGNNNSSHVCFLHVRYRFRGSPSINDGLEPLAQWSYRSDDENGDCCWTNYDDDSNAALEWAYRDEKRFSPVLRDSILVDFSTMVQTDASTGLRRAVRRTTGDDTAAARWYDDEPAATPGYADAGGGDHENVHPFPVPRFAYDRIAIGTAVDLLGLPGIFFSVALTSNLERSRCSDTLNSYLAVGYLIIVGCPLALALGLYLPLRILNHTLCRTSLIVGLSTMVVTVVLLNLGCRCACRPKGSLTHPEALATIKQERDKLLAVLCDEERGLSYNRHKVAVLASLETVVARHLERHDHGAATATGGLLLGRRREEDELFVLTLPQLQIWIRFALYQAEVSAGRVPEGTTVEGRSRGGVAQHNKNAWVMDATEDGVVRNVVVLSEAREPRF